jgi:hypothetical protein
MRGTFTPKIPRNGELGSTMVGEEIRLTVLRQTTFCHCGNSIENPERTAFQLETMHSNFVPTKSWIGEQNLIKVLEMKN